VERKLRNFLGHKFWARGYFVSTVGRDEEKSRLRKSAQDDKWSFCLTAGTLCPANQEKQ
jgi:REP element-mobilizing transposase RayT